MSIKEAMDSNPCSRHLTFLGDFCLGCSTGSSEDFNDKSDDFYAAYNNAPYQTTNSTNGYGYSWTPDRFVVIAVLGGLLLVLCCAFVATWYVSLSSTSMLDSFPSYPSVQVLR